jgi:hypothetical protein
VSLCVFRAVTIQAAVDNKHNLVVATHTINRNDLNALGAIALAKENLEVETLTVLVDRATTTVEKLRNAKTTISSLLSHILPGRAKDSATQEEYLLAKFLYNTIDDTYECPQGETLKTTGRWHKKNRTHRAKWIPI